MDQKLLTALVRTAFHEGYQTALECDVSLEDLDSAWGRSAASDDLAAYLAALPEPTGPLVERMARAIEEKVEAIENRGYPYVDGIDAAAQAALSVMLAEIEAERQAVKDSPDGRAGNGFPYHRIEALDRLTARLTGGQGDG